MSYACVAPQKAPVWHSSVAPYGPGIALKKIADNTFESDGFIGIYLKILMPIMSEAHRVGPRTLLALKSEDDRNNF